MVALRKNDIKVLSDRDHVLLRPGVYLGSTKEENQIIHLYENDKIIQKEIPYTPALLKMFDETISNSIDEAIRTNFKYATKIRVVYNEKTGVVTVKDDGRGLPIELDENSKKWTPEIIFSQLRAGSNFDDESKGCVVGQNGMGISLVTIFSKKLTIETANGSKYYCQSFENNLQKIGKPKISDDSNNYTEITYEPNYDYFKDINDIAKAKEILNSLFYKRVKDLAFAYPEITFWYNKEKISASSLKTFLKQIHEIYECNEVDNCRIGLFYSDTEFQQMSFVNGAYTSRGGTHVDYATGKIVDYIREYLKKKYKLEVKPIDVKSKLFLLFALRMQNPQFDSQTKERLISNNNFKALVDETINEKFLKSIIKNEEIITPIVEAYRVQQQVKENLMLKKMSKTDKRVRVEKYFPAVDSKKYLLLTEGDSANGLLMPALGRSIYSFFPLRGKPLNTLETKVNKVTENEEFKKIVQILNLRLDKTIQDELSHENICIATDQDPDGNHIKALLICFFYRFAPDLLKSGRIKFLRTPLIIAKKNGKIEKYFFNMKDYRDFEINNKGYQFQYMKGLGTWQLADLKTLIKNEGINHFLQTFEWNDEAESKIKSWMSKEGIDYRKEQVSKNSFDIQKV